MYQQNSKMITQKVSDIISIPYNTTKATSSDYSSLTHILASQTQKRKIIIQIKDDNQIILVTSINNTCEWLINEVI